MTSSGAQALAVLVALGEALLLVAGWQKLTSIPVTGAAALRFGRVHTVALGLSEVVGWWRRLVLGGRVMAAIVFFAYGGRPTALLVHSLTAAATWVSAEAGTQSPIDRVLNARATLRVPNHGAIAQQQKSVLGVFSSAHPA